MDPATPPRSAIDAITGRRTTHRFDPARPIDDATLASILRLATFAPSAFNLQPWRFLVVRRASNRQRLLACAFRHPALLTAPVAVVVLGDQTPDRSHLDLVVESMQAQGVLSPESAAGWHARALQSLSRQPDRAAWSSRWAMAAAATLTIAAESLGVASAVIETFDPDRLNEAFGIPNDHTATCLIALGFAAEVPPFPGRLDLNEVCNEEHFGQPWQGENPHRGQRSDGTRPEP